MVKLLIYIIDAILIAIVNIILIKNGNIGVKEPETWGGIVISIIFGFLIVILFKNIVLKYFVKNREQSFIMTIIISTIFIFFIMRSIIIEWDFSDIRLNHNIIINGLFIGLFYINSLILIINNRKNL